MTITQTMTEFTGDLPDKVSMTPDEFDAAAEDWVDYQAGIAPELNLFAQQANALAASANDIATALAAANFKGAWSDLGGGMAVPACVLHGGQYWLLLSNLADVTASEPADGNADWALLPVGSSIIAKTANHTVTHGQMAVGTVVLTNEGATGDIDFTLPTRAGSHRIGFLVAESHYIKIKPPAGERLYFHDNQQTAVNGYVRSNTPRTFFELIATAGLGYTLINVLGSLSVDE